MSGELASERWTPVQRTESVLISILSLLDDAEVSSPANVDAGVMLRKEPQKYKARVREDVEASKKDIPEDFVMPTHESTKPPVVENYDDNFWADSDAENSLGSSDSDEEMIHDDDAGDEDGKDEKDEDDEDVDDNGSDDEHDSDTDGEDEGDNKGNARAYRTLNGRDVGDSQMIDAGEL